MECGVLVEPDCDDLGHEWVWIVEPADAGSPACHQCIHCEKYSEERE